MKFFYMYCFYCISQTKLITNWSITYFDKLYQIKSMPQMGRGDDAPM